jgi:thioester reductase-like protein
VAKSGLIFFTGFPGFIGTRVVRALLESDPKLRVAALVEAKMGDRAREAAAKLDAGRIEILEGDIADRKLGLSDDQLERLRAETTIAYHLAAIYDLAVPLAIAQRVNVDGTGNVLELCASCERLERLNYVSTAYVAGDRTGVVYEHELVFGQRFKNHYESTKYQAEVWVRDAMGDVPVTVYRPAIVVGDSGTGETQKFDGPYYMLRTISRSMKMGGRIPQFGASEAPFNVVPVDFVVDALTAVAADPATVGQTLHLVDPEPISAKDLMTTLAQAYAGKQPSYKVPPKAVELSLRTKTVRKAFSGAPPESIVYLNHPVRFDTRRATDLLARHGVRCPRFDEYVGPIVEFFKDHEDDPAFAPAA